MTKVDPITVTRPRLSCDADGCDHQEPVSTVTPDLIGKPCPKCGADLLTEQDYRDTLRVLAMYQAINAEIGPVDASNDTISTFEINPHAGYVNVSKKDD